jgi:hypothetical protein
MTSNDAPFENPVNAQWIFSAYFRHIFAVAKPDTHPYCWGAPINGNHSRQQKSFGQPTFLALRTSIP